MQSDKLNSITLSGKKISIFITNIYYKLHMAFKNNYKRIKKRYIVLFVIGALFLIIRIFLPFIVKNQINKQIDELEGYSGGIKGVSLQLITGGIQVYDFTLYNEVSIDPSHPFITLAYADVSIFWGELIKGHIVVNVILDKLYIGFTRHDDDIPETEVNPIPVDGLLKELIPFRINLFRITDGKIAYRDITTSPEVDIYLSDLFVEVTNIQNIERAKDTLPGTLYIQAGALNSGSIKLDANFNLMKDIPDFEYKLKIEGVELTHFNPFFRAYADFSLNNGSFNLYSESAAHDGELKGYVKPMINNLEITPVEDDASTFQKMYEAILEGLGNLLESGETEHIGTRVDFEGRIDDPDVDVWSALWLLIRNAFFESISTDVNDTIDFDDLT